MAQRPDDIQDGQEPSGVIFKAFKGLNNLTSPERLGRDELAAAVNVDIDNKLTLRSRGGFSQLATGAFHSLWTNELGNTALVVKDGVLYAINPDYTLSAPLDIGFTPTRPVTYAEVNGSVFYSDGVQNGVVQGSIRRSWGLVPPSAPVASLSAGTLTPGRYTYCATFVRSDGQESGNGTYGQIELGAGAGITFALPATVDPTVARVRVYMTRPNGEALYRALDVPASTRTASITGGAELMTVPLRTQNLQPPPIGNIIAVSSGRMLIAVGRYLFWTEPFGYELCNLDANYYAYETDITIVAPVNEGTFVATKTATYFHEGFDIARSTRYQKAVYGGIPGTLTYVDAAFLAQPGYTGKVAIWTTPQGIVTAGNEGFIKGVLRNLTQNTLSVNRADFGSALFTQQDGINKYISLLRDSNDGPQNAFVGDQVTAQVVRNGQVISY